MHTNAIESWLLRMYRHALSTGHDLDWRFHVQSREPGRLESDYPPCSTLVIRSPYPLSNWIKFFAAFWRVCRVEKFDVVHIHADLMSAPYLLMARLAGVESTVVHVHNADERLPVASALKERLLKELFRQVCLTAADRIVGISNVTLDTFLNGRPRRTGRDLVHYYGVDPTPFANATADRGAFRRERGFPGDSLILLFAGRMVPEKNPEFVIDVLAELRRIEPRAVAVFAGSGSQEQNVLERARRLGVENVVTMLGWSSNLPAIMSCCDWFILPRPESPMEGFGLAVVEAQLAGLRMLLSQGIADDPLLPTASFCRLALSAGPKAWADAAVELLRAAAPSRAAALTALRDSPMDMNRALDGLIRLYS